MGRADPLPVTVRIDPERREVDVIFRIELLGGRHSALPSAHLDVGRGIGGRILVSFRDLHHGPSPLILPNAWDVGSAPHVPAGGFPAVEHHKLRIAHEHGHDPMPGVPSAQH
jgi:hypothetical protein